MVFAASFGLPKDVWDLKYMQQRKEMSLHTVLGLLVKKKHIHITGYPTPHRTYGLSSILQKLLQEWVDQPSDIIGERHFLFPNRDHPDAHISTSSVRRTFMRVATRAGVQGAHVHPHTTKPGQKSPSPQIIVFDGLYIDTRWPGPSVLWATAWNPLQVLLVIETLR